MVWHTQWPVGTVSVKANRSTGQDNTSYIEDTLGKDPIGTNAAGTKDHFWNVGADLDGHHRFVKLPAFTVGGNPADPTLPGTGIDGTMYLRLVNADVGRVEGFYNNLQGTYQFIPSFKSGSIAIPSTGTYTTIATIPKNAYGEIFMINTSNGETRMQSAIFKSNATEVHGWSQALRLASSSDPKFNLIFANGSDVVAPLLELKARRSQAASQIWEYRIIYRAI